MNTDLTPIHRSTSRRIQGQSPEYGPLSPRTRAPAATRRTDAAPMASNGDAAAMADNGNSAAHFLVLQPRTPPTFHGEVFEDAEDWLDQFERVARYNGWDAERKLHNVYFALDDSARTWYENHETTFPSWERFRSQLLATYVNTDRRERAESALQSRNQRPNESVAMYYEDMTRLFRRADPNMAEDKKVRHLMRGIKEELFAGLVRNPPNTTSEFLSEATTVEKTLQQRARYYNRAVNTVSTADFAPASSDSADTLRELVRSIVKEELHKMRLSAQSQPQCPSLAQIIREEVQQVVPEPVAPAALTPTPPRQTYASVLRQNCDLAPWSTSPSASAFQPRPPPVPVLPEARLRKTDVWRAPDQRPLCYHCGEAGHILRWCPYRRAGIRGFHPRVPCPPNGERSREIEEHLSTRRDHTHTDFPRPDYRPPTSTRYRSPSPRPSTSRFSRSPSPRRGN